MPQLTIEQLGELARVYKPTAEELHARSISLASGLRAHNSQVSHSDMMARLSTENGTILLSDGHQPR